MKEKTLHTYQGIVARTVAYEILKLPHICEKCGFQGRTEVHHINKDRNNNTRENILILCRRCHLDVHGVIPPKKQPILPPTVDGRKRPGADTRKQALLDKRNAATQAFKLKWGIP